MPLVDGFTSGEVVLPLSGEPEELKRGGSATNVGVFLKDRTYFQEKRGEERRSRGGTAIL